MKNLITLLLIVLSVYTFGQEKDSLPKKKLFELSFGNNVLFIPDSKLIDINQNDAVVLPTKSILFFTEFRPDKFLRVPVFFNLPTESKEFLVNGQLISERASPTFGTGLEFRLIKVNVLGNTRIELEAGPLASFIFDKNGKICVSPVLAGRVRVMRGENFVMYIGCSYSVGVNAFGLLYGTGTVF
jgi:hypothetical protein